MINVNILLGGSFKLTELWLIANSSCISFYLFFSPLSFLSPPKSEHSKIENDVIALLKFFIWEYGTQIKVHYYNWKCAMTMAKEVQGIGRMIFWVTKVGIFFFTANLRSRNEWVVWKSSSAVNVTFHYT